MCFAELKLQDRQLGPCGVLRFAAVRTGSGGVEEVVPWQLRLAVVPGGWKSVDWVQPHCGLVARCARFAFVGC